MAREVKPDHPVHELHTKRWSPYGFDDRSVSEADLRSLFEAARWAPSSYNEQPWSYLVARKEDKEAFAEILSCLVEANQAWARHASALALAVVSHHFQRNGKPNKAAVHDLGLAAANLVHEATARGLAVHQMIGILPDRARVLFNIPEGYEAYTALAIGYHGEPGNLADEIKERDRERRGRKPQGEFVFSGKWGQKSGLVP